MARPFLNHAIEAHVVRRPSEITRTIIINDIQLVDVEDEAVLAIIPGYAGSVEVADKIVHLWNESLSSKHEREQDE